MKNLFKNIKAAYNATQTVVGWIIILVSFYYGLYQLTKKFMESWISLSFKLADKLEERKAEKTSEAFMKNSLYEVSRARNKERDDAAAEAGFEW